jgi:hypothetical protein
MCLLVTNWTPIVISKTPAYGLYGYGIVATAKGRLVLYGGITNAGNRSSMHHNLNSFSEFWNLELNDILPDFKQKILLKVNYLFFVFISFMEISPIDGTNSFFLWVQMGSQHFVIIRISDIP